MGESLTQQRRVEDEGLWIVNSCQQGKSDLTSYVRELIVPAEEAPANSVPAAAVRRGILALFGIIGRKAGAGGFVSQV